MVAMEAKAAQVQAYLKLLFFLGSTASGSAPEAVLDPSSIALCDFSLSGVHLVLCLVRSEQMDEPTGSLVINELVRCVTYYSIHIFPSWLFYR